MNGRDLHRTYLDAVAQALASVPDELMARAVAEFLAAGNIVTAGRGRSGMVAAAFCRRLGQMGLSAWGLDDTTVPRLGEGDLLFAATGSGTTPTVLSLMDTARSGGARVVAVTRSPSRLDDAADVVLALEVPLPDSESAFPLGTLFEASLLAVLDHMTAHLIEAVGATESDLGARHTNLE